MPDADPKAARRQKLVAMRDAILKSRNDLLAFAKYMRPHPDTPDDASTSLYAAPKHIELIASYLTALERGDITRLIIDCPPRHGKRCDVSTPVLTPSGWKRHGDLRAGDYVFHPDGHAAEVLASNEPTPSDVEVEFSNGATIRCHEDHLWWVRDRRSRAWRLLRTSELEEEVWIGSPGARGSRARWQLPDTLGVEFPTAALPAHPYALGAWLGDGKSDSARLDCPDTEVFEAITACGYALTSSGYHTQTGVPWAAWSGPRPNVRGGLSEALHRLGVLGNKHVPDIYLRGDREQRRQLLAGLIDTDGHVEPRTGRVRIVTTSEAIWDGVMDVATSLGYRPYFSTAQPATSSSGIAGKLPVYTVAFQPHEHLPTRVPRKRIARLAARRRISIRAIRRVNEPFLANCIQVDSPDGLYLVGRALIPTHNTELATKTFLPWYMGRHPDHHTITGTYSQMFAEDLGRAARFAVQDPRFRNVFPEFQLSDRSASALRLETTKRGVHAFLGRGGAATGRGGSLIVLDDTIKDRREADSAQVRNQLWSWFTQVIATRLMTADGKILLINTRWSADDLIGRLTDPANPCYNRLEALKWTHLRLPALADDEDDLLGRAPGEALWPDRFPVSFLAGQRNLDPRGFSALYQGKPNPDEGLFFSTSDIVEYQQISDIPKGCKCFISSDHAVSSAQWADKSVFLVCYVDSEDTIWVHPDSIGHKLPTDQAIELMLSLMKKHNPLMWWGERGTIERSIGPFLRKRMKEERVYTALIPTTPIADKQSRAQSIKGRMAMQKVRFPAWAAWYPDVRNQLLSFPAGAHDDWVDAFSLIGLGLGQLNAPRASAPPPERQRRPGIMTLGDLRQQEAKSRAPQNRRVKWV